MPGATTSAIEVTNISKHGLWLLTSDGEQFLSFADFPWFRDAPVGLGELYKFTPLDPFAKK